MCIKAVVALAAPLIGLVVISITLSQNSSQAENRGPGSSFSYLHQPTDVEVTCGTDAAYFPCKTNISTGRPKWIINSKPYRADELPNNHVFNGTMLIVTNIKPGQNNSFYQCMTTHGFHRDGVTPQIYYSSVGQLIIRCNRPKVQCLPTYYHGSSGVETLKSIFTNITTDYYGSTSNVSYNLTYSELNSNKSCYSTIIPASSCPNGFCYHTLNVSMESDHCSSSSEISITVALATNSNYDTFFTKSSPIKIDAVNKFVNISLKISDSTIKCMFINQSIESEKICSIEYSKATPDCRTSSLPLNTSGSTTGGHSVNVGLDLSQPRSFPSKVCFRVMANVTGVKTVIIEGTFDIAAEINSSASSQFWIEFVSTSTLLILMTIVCRFVTYS